MCRWDDIIEMDMRKWTGFVWFRMGLTMGSCEHSNGLSGSIKCGKFLDQLNDY
jgi:hypothetical protein